MDWQSLSPVMTSDSPGNHESLATPLTTRPLSTDHFYYTIHYMMFLLLDYWNHYVLFVISIYLLQQSISEEQLIHTEQMLKSFAVSLKPCME